MNTSSTSTGVTKPFLLLVLVLELVLSLLAHAEGTLATSIPNETPEQYAARMKWWREASPHMPIRCAGA